MQQFFLYILPTLKKAIKTAWWMIRLMLPISFAVVIFQYVGWINTIASVFSPIFESIGLSGQAALVYITAFLLNIYSAIAVISSLSLDMREITIVALMCLIAHNIPIETAIQKRTGSAAWQMVVLRLLASFLGAIILNYILPHDSVPISKTIIHHSNLTFFQTIELWVNNSVLLSIKVVFIVAGLLILQRILEDMGIMYWLSRAFRPLMKPMGLPEQVSFHWIIANLVGLTYGSAIMFDEVDAGRISKTDANLLNYHIGISHSLLEDTLLFVAIGVSAYYIIFPRILLAMVAVWFFRMISKPRKFDFNVKKH